MRDGKTSNGAPDLSVAITVSGSAEYLRGCLGSIAENFCGFEYEIIVVDNGTPGGEASAAAESAGVAVIRNETNRGASAARNQGIAAARGRYILILDDDTKFLNSGMAEMLRFMDSRPDIGIAGAQLVDGGGAVQLTCRTLPGIREVLLRRLSGALPFVKKLPSYKRHHLTALGHSRRLDVPMTISAFHLLRREAAERIGPLDERMFVYFEDIDYCARCRKAGYKVVYDPAVRVWHKERREGGRGLFNPYTKHLVKSFFIYYFKNRKDIRRINRECPGGELV